MGSSNTAHAFQAVRDSSSTQHLALLIQQADVVMLFRPINTQEDHGHLLNLLIEPEEVHHDLMVKCSPGTPSHQWLAPSLGGGGPISP